MAIHDFFIDLHAAGVSIEIANDLRRGMNMLLLAVGSQFCNSFIGQNDVVVAAVKLAHLEPDYELVLKHGMRNVDSAVVIDFRNEISCSHVRVLAIWDMPESEKREAAGAHNFEVRMPCKKLLKFLSPGNVIANPPAQSFKTIGSHQEPKFSMPEIAC